jgi:prepilin signal peptidase PulO-like enzyme (type II secretory pathway)
MPWALVPALSVFAVLSGVLAVVDARTRHLPDAIVLPGGAAVVLLLGAAALAIGEPARLAGIGGGAVGAFTACLALHLARPAAFGGGDVKLAALCGAVLGWGGFEAVASGLALAFLAGGIGAAGALLASARGASIAFGPFLLFGAWWRVLTGL